MDFATGRRLPGTAELRFIEMKGRAAGPDTITVTRNEILFSLDAPDAFVLAIVELDGMTPRVHHVRRPFQRTPDFLVTSLNYRMKELIARGAPPE